MRAATLVLLSVSAAFALQCWNNGIMQTEKGPKAVVQKIDCKDGEEYCMKMWSLDENNKTVTHRQCGDGMCDKEYCSDETSMCCCKGNYCNGATTESSLVMTSLIVGAAAWLRL